MSALDNQRDRQRLLTTGKTVDTTLVVPMTLISVAAGGLNAVVRDLNGADIQVGCNPCAAWDKVQTASVLRDQNSGRPVFALCPASPPGEETPGSKDPVTPTTTRKTTVITPASTSTWAPSYGGWGRFNAGRYGGASDLYQHGEGIGAGTLHGAAFYGDRVRALGATAIVSATVHLMGNGSNRGTWQPVLQACTQKTQPSGDVTTTGPTFTGSLSGTGETDIGVAAAVELMRTGQAGGLTLVGTTYGGLYGTSRGRGMALSITYEVTQ